MERRARAPTPSRVRTSAWRVPPHAERYERAEEFIATARELWDSWPVDAVRADGPTSWPMPARGPSSTAAALRRRRPLQRAPEPTGPSGRPAGRRLERRSRLAARSADAIFSRHSTGDGAREFYRDVKGRLERYGRRPDALKILPAATFVLGDTDAEAVARAAEVRRQQVSRRRRSSCSSRSGTATCPTTTPTARCRPSTRSSPRRPRSSAAVPGRSVTPRPRRPATEPWPRPRGSASARSSSS